MKSFIQKVRIIHVLGLYTIHGFEGHKYLAIDKKGVAYPISKNSMPLIEEEFAKLPEDLVKRELVVKAEIKRIPRRIKEGDSVRIKSIALKQFKSEFDFCCGKGAIGKIFGAVVKVYNNGKFDVILDSDKDTQMTLHRKDVELVNVEDMHEVAYLCCTQCGNVLR